MKFSYTILYVPSVENTISFYETAFGFQRKFVTPEGDYGELATGETTLAFAALSLGENNIEGSLISPDLRKQPFAIEVSFILEKLEEDFEKALAAGAILERPVETKSWGQQVGYLRDINGFLVEIGSPIDH